MDCNLKVKNGDDISLHINIYIFMCIMYCIHIGIPPIFFFVVKMATIWFLFYGYMIRGQHRP